MIHDLGAHWPTKGTHKIYQDISTYPLKKRCSVVVLSWGHILTSFLGPHEQKLTIVSCGRNDPPSYYIYNVFFKIDHCSIWPVTTILTNLHGHLIHHPGVSKSDSQPLGPTLAERALNCSSMSRNLRAHMMSGVRRDGSNRQQLASGKRWQKHAKAAAEHFGTPADKMFNICKSPLHFSSNSWLQML